jgi:Fic family protein
MYQSVAETAERWQMSQRSVRHYCAQGRVPGAFLSGKTWRIPADAQRPPRATPQARNLLAVLRSEKAARASGGIYHKVQIELAYNSSHMEGSTLTHEQTRHIFETNAIDAGQSPLRVDDIVETVNHFRCLDMVIDAAHRPLGEAFIKRLHRTLKTGTSDARSDWFAVGQYKRFPNEVGGRETTPPEQVASAMKALLAAYNASPRKDFRQLLDFHHALETIHPFQDGNGRVGRLILFKECLRNDIVPFVIGEQYRLYYYRGLQQWQTQPGYLTDTCLAAQDRFKTWLDYFCINYKQ